MENNTMKHSALSSSSAALLSVLLLLCVTALPAGAMDLSRSNFVFFLVDDLGWADLGAYGSQFHETPNIDALAKSGTRFTQGYAACPVCSPTRASILTGRHPVRVDVTDWIPGMATTRAKNPRFQHVNDRDSLALKEVTIAELLKKSGYQTFFAGKWHLGKTGSLPTDQGFEINVGGFHVGSPPGGYYSPWKNPHLKSGQEGEYLTERLTDESIRFLENRDASRPFFLYLSYYNVHTPIQPYRKRIDHFRRKAEQQFDSPSEPLEEHRGQSRTRQDNADYASMVAAVDDSVGTILGKLEALDLTDDTVVIFFSDNGGLCTKPRPGPTSNLPLRSGKGWLYEGGIREPMLIRAPGVSQAVGQCDEPVVSMDFFPTILDLAGIPQRPDLHADGISLTPLLRGERRASRPLFWHYPHYHGSTWTPGAAVRDGDWKLIELYEFDEVELYNLKDDLGERVELSKKHPQTTRRLRQLLREWQEGMGASKLQPNPDYRPTKR